VPPRAVVHVGAPKTGTTYLQAVLWRNRTTLAEAGVLYPLERAGEHFHAALDVRQMSWGGRADGPWLGAWPRVAERIAAWDGSVVLSNELLGGATRAQAAQLAEALTGSAGRELHVVFTARDLARQLPSDWQEHIKHRHDVGLTEFVDDLVTHGIEARAPFGELFWGLHDAERVLDTWAGLVPPEHIHLVTVAQQRGSGRQLWDRFAVAAGLADLDLDLDVDPANVSMGVAEAELVRRLNTHIKGRFPQRHYDTLVRQVLAERVLTSKGRLTAASERPTLPAHQWEWVEQWSRRLVDTVSAAGYDVVGDLEDLLPAPAGAGRQPEELSADDLLPVTFDAMAGLLRHLVHVLDNGPEVRGLRERNAELTAELTRARTEVAYWRDGGLAHRLVRFSDQHRWLMPARRGYLAVRERLRQRSSDADGSDRAD
jgi:hypothetical protein